MKVPRTRLPATTRRKGELTTISLEASRHLLGSGSLRGRMVGSLTTEVLEDQLVVIKRMNAAAPTPQHLSDIEAINNERQRRWFAFTA